MLLDLDLNNLALIFGGEMNRVKEMLAEGKAAIGAAGFVGDDTGFLAGSGFDFLLFDTQHAPVEIKQNFC